MTQSCKTLSVIKTLKSIEKIKFENRHVILAHPVRKVMKTQNLV